MTALYRAPAKLNLALYLGATREDGLHEISSIFVPLALADQLQVSEPTHGKDVISCPEVAAPDLTERALTALRERGWDGPSLRIEVAKRIPIAAGLGGGSADAAAVLRLAGEDISEPEKIAAELGADVPSQLEPRSWLVGGAGERLEPLQPPAPLGVVLVPSEPGLSAREVYAEADRLGLDRGEGELARCAARLREAAGASRSPLDYAELLVNDLQQAVHALRPQIGDALSALSAAGAERALVTGSGPTAFGLFADGDAAGDAAEALRREFPAVIATRLDPEPVLEGAR